MITQADFDRFNKQNPHVYEEFKQRATVQEFLGADPHPNLTPRGSW